MEKIFKFFWRLKILTVPRALIYSGSLPYENYIINLYDLEHDHKIFNPRAINVFAIQPFIKWQPDKDKKTISNPYLQLEELTSLVQSLPYYNVAAKKIVPVKSYQGNFLTKEKLDQMDNDIYDAFAIGINKLNVHQFLLFEEMWRKPIYDRYTLVLKIFKCYARSKEARIQIALAYIPYLKSKIQFFKQLHLIKANHDFVNLSTDEDSDFINFCRDDSISFHDKMEILRLREDKLRKELEKIKRRHTAHVTPGDSSNQPRPQNPVPIVAVVGYTNSGKTSLIKALASQGDKLQPENRLFATLDVSFHQGLLPYMEKVLYLDTIGFISDIPTALINAFQVTLREINNADVIIHIRDSSHPDTVHQNQTVLQTLKELGIRQELRDGIIEVHNKIDLLEDRKLADPTNQMPINPSDTNLNSTCYPISVTKAIGLKELLNAIHAAILERQNKQFTTLKIPIQLYSKIFSFLHKMNVSLLKTEPTEDSKFYIIEAFMDPKSIQIFKSQYDVNYIQNIGKNNNNNIDASKNL